MPGEEISKALALQQSFRYLKSEIDSGLAIIHERMEEVRLILRANCSRDDAQVAPGDNSIERANDGLLVQGLQNYLNCLEFNHIQLEQLFRLDEVHWQEHVAFVRRDARQVEDEIQLLLAKQAEDLQ